MRACSPSTDGGTVMPNVISNATRSIRRRVVGLNRPLGEIGDLTAKITALQRCTAGSSPMTPELKHLLVAKTTCSTDGFWEDYDWDKALTP